MRMRYQGLALVVVLLMLAAASGCATENTAGPVFSGPKSFTTDVTSGKVASVKAESSTQTLAVELTDGSSYTAAYTDLATVDKLLGEHPNVSYSVDGKVRQ
jgi:hypothetical protein